jgi:hypothetical protein
MYPMELTSDRQEISLRLLQNGRYVWTITVNDPIVLTSQEMASKLKNIDKALQDAFPNHVKENSVSFKELD